MIRLNWQTCKVAWRRQPAVAIQRYGCKAVGCCLNINLGSNDGVLPAFGFAGMQRCYKSTRAAVVDSFTVVPPPLSATATSTKTISRADQKSTLQLETGTSAAPTTRTTTMTRHQPATMTYTGNNVVPFTSTLHIVTPEEDAPSGTWPAFRMMDEDGKFRDPHFDGRDVTAVPDLEALFWKDTSSPMQEPILAGSAFGSHLQEVYSQYEHEFEQSDLLRPASKTTASFTDKEDVEEGMPLFMRAYRQMVRLREMDKIMLNAQRQGRIAFYMACTGEEAIHMGSASALNLQDQVFAQYREAGVLMWRGFSLEQFTNQLFSNDLDLGKGRQMPLHYGSRALNYHTISSPLGTQIPQAAGAAYRLKLAGKKNIVICFFGDGCSSTTDFHSGLNFAATLKVPVVFFCRNNGYAISTPVTDQYAGDGIVSRAPGYGMAAIRIDGNDLFAVHAAVREARNYALEHSAPVLIEAMTYRVRDHSTSDDSTRYRSASEVSEFAEHHDPLTRLQLFMIRYGWLTDKEATRIRENERLAVLQAMEKAEQRPIPLLEELFSDVYHDLPPHLRQQQNELFEHIAKYPNRYGA